MFKSYVFAYENNFIRNRNIKTVYNCYKKEQDFTIKNSVVKV